MNLSNVHPKPERQQCKLVQPVLICIGLGIHLIEQQPDTMIVFHHNLRVQTHDADNSHWHHIISFSIHPGSSIAHKQERPKDPK
jgi:hypothetical protein